MKTKKLFFLLSIAVSIIFASCNKDDDDETTNQAPAKPTNPAPTDEAVNVDVNLATLAWQCSDPDGDVLTYDVYFGIDANPALVETIEADLFYPLTGLNENTTYYWKIVAKDGSGNETEGDIWNFTTADGGSSNKVLKWKTSVVDNSGTGVLGVGYNCNIVVDDNLGLHTVYTDRDNQKVKYAYLPQGETSWQISEIDDSGASLAALVIENSTLHAVYQHKTLDVLKYAFKPISASSWSISAIDNTGSYYLDNTDTYIGMEADGDGGLHIVAANTGGNNIMQYFYKPQSGDWTKEVLDNTMSVSRQPAIAIVNNAIHVSYGTDSYAKYAEKQLGATTWNIGVVSSADAYHTTIGVNSSGDVHYGYFDYSSYAYKIATKEGAAWSINDYQNVKCEYPEMNVSVGDTVSFCFSNDAGQGFKYAYKLPGETAWVSQMIDSQAGCNYVQYTNIVSADNGHVYATYQIAVAGGRNKLMLADIYWE